MIRSGNIIQRVRLAAMSGSWHELNILLRSTKITTTIQVTEPVIASEPELLIQDTQRAEWNMLAAHAKYYVLRNMMVKAMEVGQVSFMSDGQIGYTSISSQSLEDAVSPCMLAAEISGTAASDSLSAAVGNQHLITYSMFPLAVYTRYDNAINFFDKKFCRLFQKTYTNSIGRAYLALSVLVVN